MKTKQPIIPNRLRKIEGGFAFIEHRFLQKGFFHHLNHQALVLYLFLVLVSDRQGISYYGYDQICTFTKLSVDEYIEARNTLIEDDLLAIDGRFFQILSLPKTLKKCGLSKPKSPVKPKGKPESLSNIFSRLSRGNHD